MAMLNTHPMPEEARRAVDRDRFGRRSRSRSSRRSGLARHGWDIAETLGAHCNARSSRHRTGEEASQGHRSPSQKDSGVLREKEVAAIDMPELPSRLADELGSPDGKKRTRATLRKLYDRDLIKLAQTKQRSVLGAEALQGFSTAFQGVNWRSTEMEGVRCRREGLSHPQR